MRKGGGAIKPCRRIAAAVLLTVMAGSTAPAAEISELFKFIGGAATAYAIHEGGHVLAAAATGTDLTWEMNECNQVLAFTEHADSDGDALIVYSAGLLAQAVAGEIVLASDVDKNSSYVRGLMAWNVINPVMYALSYWGLGLSHSDGDGSYRCDITGIERHADASTANIFAGAMAVVAISQGYRFIKTQSWAPQWMRHHRIELTAAPLAGSGFQAGFKIHF